MQKMKGRIGAALAILLLASFVLACSTFKKMSGGGGISEANKLVQEAKEHLREVDRISDESDENVTALNRAENDNNAAEVKRVLGELIESIDKGLEHGQSAADKIDKASKQDVNAKYKEYLSLKAQAFRKQVEAFKSLREAAVIERDNFGVGGQKEEDAKKEFREKYDNYKKLIAEAKKLHRQADDIARENPDLIKSS